MADLGHVHEWARVKFVRDFCHYSVVEKTCASCGQREDVMVERDFDLNPMQIAFADRNCAICRRELRGAEPDSWKAPAAPTAHPST